MAIENIVFAVIITIFVTLHEGYGLHDETILNSNYGCFGNNDQFNLSCPSGQIISIQSITLGAKLSSLNCLPNMTYCCSPSNITTDDCIFVHDHTTYDNYHQACNGRNQCSRPIFNDIIPAGTCSGGFPAITEFAQLQYKCLNESDNVVMCRSYSYNTTGDSLYIGNDNFPETIRSTATSCSCSVEANDQTSNLDIVTIHRWLEGNTSMCDQSLSLKDYSLNTLANWGCADNTQVEASLTIGNYAIFEFSNSITTDGGRYWFEIRASNQSSTLHVNCPAIYPPTTSTSSTTSTTVTTTTSTTSSTTSTTASTSTTSLTTTTLSTTTEPHTATIAASTSKEDDDSLLLILIIISAIAAVLLVLLIVVICCWRFNRQRKVKPDDQRSLRDCDKNEDDAGQTEKFREVPSQPYENPIVINMPHTSASPSQNIIEQCKPMTCDSSMNTDTLRIHSDDKDIQVSVSMEDKACHMIVITESRGVNTPASIITMSSDAQTNTEEILTVSRGTKTDEIDRYEINKNDRNEMPHEAYVEQTTNEDQLNDSTYDTFQETSVESENVEQSSSLNSDINGNEEIQGQPTIEQSSCNYDGQDDYQPSDCTSDEGNDVKERDHETHCNNDVPAKSESDKFAYEGKTTRSKCDRRKVLNKQRKCGDSLLESVVKGFCESERNEKKLRIILKRKRNLKKGNPSKGKVSQKDARVAKRNLKSNGIDSGVETGVETESLESIDTTFSSK